MSRGDPSNPTFVNALVRHAHAPSSSNTRCSSSC